MRGALYPPISAAGKAQRRRREDRERERKTVRKENEQQHGHRQAVWLLCESVLRCWPVTVLLCHTQPLRYVGQPEDNNVREWRRSSETLLLNCAALPGFEDITET